jgi:hypothetical protein
LVCPLRYHGVTFLPVRDVEHAFLPCEHHSALNQSQKRIEMFHYSLMNNKSKDLVILIGTVTIRKETNLEYMLHCIEVN